MSVRLDAALYLPFLRQRYQFTRTAKEVVRAFNSLDDIGEHIAKKHFKVTESIMSSSERKALRERLEKIRAGFFYISLDYRHMLDLPIGSLHQAESKACFAYQNAGSYIQ